jgi:hypothetical protein
MESTEIRHPDRDVVRETKRRVLLHLESQFIETIAHLLAFAINALPVLVDAPPRSALQRKPGAPGRPRFELKCQRGFKQDSPALVLNGVTELIGRSASLRWGPEGGGDVDRAVG